MGQSPAILCTPSEHLPACCHCSDTSEIVVHHQFVAVGSKEEDVPPDAIFATVSGLVAATHATKVPTSLLPPHESQSSEAFSANHVLEAVPVDTTHAMPSGAGSTVEDNEHDRPDRSTMYCAVDSLKEVLRSGDVALLRGSWLIALSRAQGVLPRRQDLPADAICPTDVALASQIVAVSHCWWSPEHPDPNAEKLHFLAEVVEQCHAFHAGIAGWDTAIFLDWCSLHQKPRSTQEEAAFQRGVRTAGFWFGHRETSVWILPKVPWGARNYCDRGWPTFEKTISQLIATGSSVLDFGCWDSRSCANWPSTVAVCSRPRSPPVAPDTLARELRTKVFRISEDYGLVVEIYKQTFEDLIGSARDLDFSALDWGDGDTNAVATVLLECSHLRRLGLGENRIGDGGIGHLADVLPLCRRLQELELSGNEIGDRGAKCLAEALPCCGYLQDLRLAGNTIGNSGVSRLAAAIPRCGHLKELLLSRNEIGDEGADQIATAIPHCMNLRELDLNENEICDGGAARLAVAIPRCGLLRKLGLARNRVGDGGAKRVAEAIPFCRQLEEIGLGGHEIGEILGGDRIRDPGASSLAAAFRHCTSLKRIDFGDNQIGDCGAERLAAAIPHLTGLTAVNLSRNRIGDGGAEKLKDAISRCRWLRRLQLPGNALGDGAKRHLREAWIAAGRPDDMLTI